MTARRRKEHLKAETLNVDDLNYSQRKLWITSFLYGLLRPLDAILPYRMEGNVELPSGEGQNMFCFWKGRLTDLLIDAVEADGGTLIHLATKEYQHLFDWQLVRKEVRIVQPLFYVRKGSELKILAVRAKTCRGAMTRFIIENRMTNQSSDLQFASRSIFWNYMETHLPIVMRRTATFCGHRKINSRTARSKGSKPKGKS